MQILPAVTPSASQTSSPKPRDQALGRPPSSAQNRYRPPSDELVLVGSHGGAGTSTLATLLGPGKVWDLGVVPRSHVQRGRTYISLSGRKLILVARGTVPSARLATAAARTVLQSGYPLAALIVVADGAGPEPREASARFRLLEAQLAQGVLRMPFVPALRLVDAPADITLPRAASRALAKIREAVLLSQGASPPERQ